MSGVSLLHSDSPSPLRTTTLPTAAITLAAAAITLAAAANTTASIASYVRRRS